MEHDATRIESHDAWRIDAIAIAEVAAAAQADVRSVLKRIRGEPVRGRVGARIDRELATQRSRLKSSQSTLRRREGG